MSKQVLKTDINTDVTHNDKLLIHLKTKYGWDLEQMTEEELKVVEDVANATLEVYKHEKQELFTFPKAKTTEEKVQYSLFRMKHLMEAASIDKKFLLEYGKWDKGSKIEAAMRKSFPLIGAFIKLINDKIKSSPNITPEQLEMNDEMSYYILEVHEHLTKQVGLDKE